MPATAHTARMIAKLLASRPTTQDEIPDLIDQVHRTLANIGRPRQAQKPAAVTDSAPSVSPKRRGRKPRLVKVEEAAVTTLPAPAAPVAPPTPVLLRRAEIKEIVEVAPIQPAILDGISRGVVRWFDPQTRRGALRIQGVSGDVAVEPTLLAQSNIARLFKGQEVEARLSGTAGAPLLLELRLRGSGADAHVNSGMVRARQIKPVMVELKREASKRGAARDAAELLLPDRTR